MTRGGLRGARSFFRVPSLDFKGRLWHCSNASCRVSRSAAIHSFRWPVSRLCWFVPSFYAHCLRLTPSSRLNPPSRRTASGFQVGWLLQADGRLQAFRQTVSFCQSGRRTPLVRRTPSARSTPDSFRGFLRPFLPPARLSSY